MLFVRTRRIQRVTNPTTFQDLLNKLKAIKQEAYADIFDTYDYNIIAERVLELLGEYEEKTND